MVSFAHGWLNWDSLFSKERLYAFLEAVAVSLSSRIIVASRSMEEDLLTKRVDAKKIFYIPYGIDIERFNIDSDAKSFRKEFNIPLDIPLIGTVGRIHPWKGQRFFIEAAKLVSKKYPKAKFIIVGDVAYNKHAHYKRELLMLIKALKLKDRVILIGTRRDIPQVMRSMDLFVLPSLHEPFGIVIIEAQACGKPVVATAVGGIPEAMKGGETGIIIRPGDTEELANAIVALLKDKKRMQKMGLAGRKRVEDLFSKDRMVRKTEELYESIMMNS